MENEIAQNGNMENIFYAALALHVAGKPINKENIRVVLHAAGTPVDEPSLDIIAAFMESLKAAHLKNESIGDPRIIKLLTAALSQHKIQVEQLEALLVDLARSIPPETKTGESIPKESSESEIRSHPELSDERGTITQSEAIQKEVAGESAKEPVLFKGRYIYGITAGGKEVRLGPIGIGGSEVYTISYQDLGAVVHNCPAEPYQSLDDEKVKGWIKAHQNVLDTAKEQFNIIIPLCFDTILKPVDDSITPDQVVRDWLKNDYERFHTVISRIEGKDEYAIQVSYSPSQISTHLPEPSGEVKTIREELAKKSPGIAYIYKQKLDKAIKADMERLADSWFKNFYNRINKHADSIVVEKNRKLDKDQVMLLNLSCLVAKEKVESLGEELEIINNMEGFSVHFSGPWPPYSFVAKPIIDGGKVENHGSH